MKKKCWDLIKKWLNFSVVYCLKFQWICNRFTRFLGGFFTCFLGIFSHIFSLIFAYIFCWFFHAFSFIFFTHFSFIFSQEILLKFYEIQVPNLFYPITITIPILTLIVPHIPVWPGPSSVLLTHTPEQSWPKVESHCQLLSWNTTLVGVDHTITTTCPGMSRPCRWVSGRCESRKNHSAKTKGK